MYRHRLLTLLIAVLLFSSCTAQSYSKRPIESSELPPLPMAMANNAVAAVNTEQGQYLMSFNGLSGAKEWSSTTAHTFVLAPGAAAWEQASDVPGVQGRLATIAASVGKRAYVFGGYTVAENHDEVSLPLVHSFDPASRSFKRLADMPVPVDDAMALVYENRYIYLISGWHDTANVNLVQRYDTVEDVWVQATAYPGAPVFGHSGGIVDNQLVVCGGVEISTHSNGPREFVMNQRCFAGTIRADNPRRIDWRNIEPMPGAARYRMAAAGSQTLSGVVFVGGSDNPYNYNGIGYNGTPSEPVDSVWIYSLDANNWRSLGVQKNATMDHRGLVKTQSGFVTVGGMFTRQRVTDQVVQYRLKPDSTEK